ncbi:hypothetical protein [Myxacorys almedinensis]|uniref:Uncharacterized protein n=1 Tax=Myxacorys almedinensis A TaxID=2690445 RepID=A0A8J7Z2Y0_9CYAN|nr:hypothetical protein [Myxacorys almedinensis]NDJ17153.1 hypothetical protein [Myxacorys almedinensis A]
MPIISRKIAPERAFRIPRLRTGLIVLMPTDPLRHCHLECVRSLRAYVATASSRQV